MGNATPFGSSRQKETTDEDFDGIFTDEAVHRHISTSRSTYTERFSLFKAEPQREITVAIQRNLKLAVKYFGRFQQ